MLPQFRNINDLTYRSDLQLLYLLVTGGNCLGYEDLTINNVAAVGFQAIPAGASKALILIEADSTTVDMTKVMRWKEDGNNPTSASGMPLGNLSVYECGADNLSVWRGIGIEAGKVHTARISYYG